MSLGIAFKGPEGIVLATDSRVTLNVETKQPDGTRLIFPSTFDNATKLLKVNGQDHVGVITFGLGAIGTREPRTAHSFIPEFEAELNANSNERLSTEEFAAALSGFFMRQWSTLGMPSPSSYQNEPMVFVVGGYDNNAAYGRIFQFLIPSAPDPAEQLREEFGTLWGGQSEFVDRIINGYDGRLTSYLQDWLGQGPEKAQQIAGDMKQQLSMQIPYQFLPLQDCVDLSIFLIRATINLQRWAIGHRGVGGAIDVATITRTEGYQVVQQKQITGE